MKQLSKIAYLEDDPNVQLLAKFALGTIAQLDLRIYSSGQAAFEDLTSFMPDLILLDVLLPDMDGVQIFHQLQSTALLSNIPVIFLTAKFRSAEIEELLGLGALAVLSKPFDPFSIAQEIQAHWQKTANQR